MRHLGRALATVFALLSGLVLVAAPASAHPEPFDGPGSGGAALPPAAVPSPFSAPEPYAAAASSVWFTLLLAGAVIVLAVVVAVLLRTRRPHRMSPQHA